MTGSACWSPLRILLLALVLATGAPACQGEMGFLANPDVDVSDFDDVTVHRDIATSPDIHTAPDVQGAPDAPPSPDTSAPPDVDDAPRCDNGIIEDGETCDPPSTCPVSCDDGNVCTVGTMSGSPATCDVLCSFEPITACVSGDGCCPAGCTVSNDSDCSFDCRDADAWPQDWAAFETEVVRLFNERRAAGATCGIYGEFAAASALTMHTNVQQAARCHSVDMWENTTMSHTGSDGSSLGQRLNREGYSGWSAAAENVARGQSTPEAVVTAWMRSDGHCRNIMNASYRDVGIGFVNRYWTAKFGRK